MKASTAIRTFFNSGPICNEDMFYLSVTITEIKDFKSACNPEEYKELGRQACELLGETFDD